MLYAGWNLVRERVVRTPADRGLVDGQDEEVMAVLGSVSDSILIPMAPMTGAYQMKRMRSLVQVINHQVDPSRVLASRQRELVVVPAVSLEADERRPRLRSPGGHVEEPEGHVFVDGEFLDLGVDDVCLLGFFRERG